MSDATQRQTPRTDEVVAELEFPWPHSVEVVTRHAERLERELSEMQFKLTNAQHALQVHRTEASAASEILRSEPTAWAIFASDTHEMIDLSLIEPDEAPGQYVEPLFARSATPQKPPRDPNVKYPRLFYWEDAEDCWCPAEGLEVDNIISTDLFFKDGDIEEIRFKREDMTDAEFEAIPEG